MDITVSSPGSPGTSFTENVKDKIVLIFDVLQSNDDFASIRDLGTVLEAHGFNWNYARNVLPFLRNCRMVNYQDNIPIKNKSFFTNIGYAYVDILKSIKVAKMEPDSDLKNAILSAMDNIQKEIYFQSLVLMMKNPDCNYGYDFFDVLRFVNQYESIDSTEYMLIEYERENYLKTYWTRIGDLIKQYRDGSIEVNVATKTKNNQSGAAKSVNSFPYVSGNFEKAGVFYKGDGNRYYAVKERTPEIVNAIKEVNQCQNLAQNQ